MRRAGYVVIIHSGRIFVGIEVVEGIVPRVWHMVTDNGYLVSILLGQLIEFGVGVIAVVSRGVGEKLPQHEPPGGINGRWRSHQHNRRRCNRFSHRKLPSVVLEFMEVLCCLI